MTTATHTRLIPDGPPDDGQRQKYKPVVATVTGFSQYNPEQFSLSGVDGFWSLAPRLAEKMDTPKNGISALWTLTTRPKTGPKAKPGSVYMDVIAVAKVPQGYAEDEQDEPEPEGWGEPPPMRSPAAPWNRNKPHPAPAVEQAPEGYIGPAATLPAKWQIAP